MACASGSMWRRAAFYSQFIFEDHYGSQRDGEVMKCNYGAAGACEDYHEHKKVKKKDSLFVCLLV